MSLDRNRVSWTSAELLTEVRRKAALPSGSLKWTDAVLLREASDVLRSFAGWAMERAGSGRYIAQLERATAITTAYGTSREIMLPPHAVADTIDGVFWVDVTGAERRLEPIDLNSQPTFDSPSASGDPWGYALLSGTIRVYPQPTAGGTFRVNYQRRLPELISAGSEVTAPTLVADAGSGSTTFTVASAAAYTVGETLDLLSSYSPYRLFLADMVITGKTATTVTVSVPYAQVSGFDAGSGTSLVPSGTSPYVHLPQEFRSCVTFRVASHVLRMVGDDIGAEKAGLTAETELGRALDMISPRTKSQRQVLASPHSLIRSRRFSRWGWQ